MSLARAPARAFARSPAISSRSHRSRASSVITRADGTAGAHLVKVDDVKDTIGRGFIVVDIRSPEEWQEGTKKTWKKICLAVMDEKGEIEFNPYFVAEIKNEWPNKMSRILLCCDDGTMRSEAAYKAIVKAGYTQVKIIEGGSDAYFAKFPLTAEDRKTWKLADQPGDDLSVLVSGVDMRQRSEKFF